MGKLSGRLRAAVVTGAVAASVAAAVGAAQPASAAPNVCTDDHGYFWSTEQDMADAQGGDCRSTYLINPAVGNLASRSQLVQHQGLYSSWGIPRQFLWYAPEQLTTIDAQSPQRWSDCAKQSPRDGIACRAGSVVTNSNHTISYDFGFRPVALHTLKWQNNFIALVCGNFGVPFAGNFDAPVPTVNGFKFNDANRNHVQDPGEGGVEGIEFHLIRLSSEFGDQANGYVGSTFSGADGSFAFALNDMGPGNYRVEEIAHDG
jgi:hypothetical protein